MMMKVEEGGAGEDKREGICIKNHHHHHRRHHHNELGHTAVRHKFSVQINLSNGVRNVMSSFLGALSPVNHTDFYQG